MCVLCSIIRPQDALGAMDQHARDGGTGLVLDLEGTASDVLLPQPPGLGLVSTAAMRGISGDGGGTPPAAAWTWDQIANQLTDGYWNGAERSFSVSADRIITVNLTTLSDGAERIARAALDVWADASGLQFQDAASADITFSSPAGGGASSTSTFSGATIVRSTVVIPDSWAPLHLNGYMLQTYMHEIGHALGLGHAGDYDGGAQWGVDNLYDNDSWSATVMSYFDQTENPLDPAGRQVLSTVMPADVIAIRNLYGTVTAANTGDTTWGYNSTMGGALQRQLNMWTNAEPDDRLYYAGHDFAFTVIDDSGIDTLDFSTFSMNQNLTLVELGYSDIDGQIDNVAIARGSVIENGVTGAGNDTLTGNAAGNALTGNAGNDQAFGGAGNDTLSGGLGNDTLDGGTGRDALSGGAANDTLTGGGDNDTLVGGEGADFLDGGKSYDTASYADATAAVQAELQNAALNLGEAAGDTYFSIEYMVGSAFGDVLGGNNGNNLIDGGAGNDSLRAFSGNDTLDGGTGADTLVGGFGADLLSGGDDFDFASYTSARNAVRADLRNLAGANTGDAAGDSFRGIEGLMGSSFGDVLIGDDLANLFYAYGGNDAVFGQGGNDTLGGNGGADTLRGGAGDDSLEGGAGADAFAFESGRDRIVDFTDNADELWIETDRLPIGMQTVQDVLSRAVMVNGGVRITFSATDVLFLESFTNIAALSNDIVLV